MRKKLFLLSITLAAFAGIILFANPSVRAQVVQGTANLLPSFSVLGQSAPVLVTPEQVKSAGFTNVVVQLSEPAQDRFLPPNYYFHVKETVSGSQGAAWGDAANLLAVLVEPKLNPNLVFNNGQVEVHDLQGRTQTFLTTANYYIEVTGPDAKKVAALVTNLGSLYK